MSPSNLYRDTLLDHYRHPRNYGALDRFHSIKRGSNPLCGDDVEVGIALDGETLTAVGFRGRGCSVCIASASMMTEAVTGMHRCEVLGLAREMQDWFSSGDGSSVQEPPETLAPLAAVREYPARRRCVLLAWEALTDALGPIPVDLRACGLKEDVGLF
jgi:nitrogen fixation NifU-like protein